MRSINNLITIICCMLLITSCGDLLSDYESNNVEPMIIDDNICSILNEMESVTALTSIGDSLSTTALFDTLVKDTTSFLTLSNAINWRIPVDSMCYFMVFAPQQADSYIVALNSSSEFALYDSGGNVIAPDNEITSLKNIAGCSDVRVRQAYSGLSGAYLGRLVNPNVNSLKMVFMNTNQPPSAAFNTSSNLVSIGDTITFTNQSQNGTYPIQTYSWDFGDDNTNSDSSIVEHAYADSGLYSPSLTVSDGYLFHTLTKNEHINVNKGSEE